MHMELVDSIVQVMDLTIMKIMCLMAPRSEWIDGEALKDLGGLDGIEHGSRRDRGAHGLTKILIQHVDFW